MKGNEKLKKIFDIALFLVLILSILVIVIPNVFSTEMKKAMICSIGITLVLAGILKNTLILSVSAVFDGFYWSAFKHRGKRAGVSMLLLRTTSIFAGICFITAFCLDVFE